MPRHTAPLDHTVVPIPANAWACCVFALSLMGLAGCTSSPDASAPDRIVATAYGVALKASDLVDEIPAGLSEEDSTARAERFITGWLQRQTLAHLALTELPAEALDFERPMARYRESLLIHAYEDHYLRDHLDTALTLEALEAFRDEQADLFRLDIPLYRARWIVFPVNKPFPNDIADMAKQLASNETETLSALASRCTDAGMPFDFDAERWWTWDELGGTLPLEPRMARRQQEARTVSRIEWSADSASGRLIEERALLLITDRLNEGDVSPVDRVAERITELLLHRRRNLTLADMRQQAVQAAWAENAITTAASEPDRPEQ